MSKYDIKDIELTNLDFDKENPRLVEFSIHPKSSEEEIIKILWEAMDAKEIAMSIAASGFFRNDPLIAMEGKDGRFIVIEGNRRLAAAKILYKKSQYKALFSDIPEISDANIAELSNLPVVIQSRQDAWQFLGFKHVNGPAKWGSYAKAKYISDIHNKFNIPLDQIGNQIGDTNNTVQRLYHGLMVIDQAEREKVFFREDSQKKPFPFSHIYVGLQREGIKKFLDLKKPDEESIDPVPKGKIKELGELLNWIYGSKKDDISPVVQSQNPHLRELDEVLQNRESLAAIRSNRDLSFALSLTREASAVFEEELLSAKRSLLKAKSLISEGYDNSTELLKIADTVADIANDLFEEMEIKQRKDKKRDSRRTK